jgi:hypothetical protein
MVFRVGDEWLALPTATLGEVTAPALVHSLPHRRHAALIGVAAVRGALLTCISLALLFGESAEPTEPTEPTESNGRGGQDAQRAARFLILGQGRNAIAARCRGSRRRARHAGCLAALAGHARAPPPAIHARCSISTATASVCLMPTCCGRR